MGRNSKKAAIYKIVNKLNNDLYIGSSSDVVSRWSQHKRDLKNNKHHSIILQRAWNKYGEENFDFILIGYCLDIELLDKENALLISLEPKYNICKIAGNRLGYKHREESLDKMREHAKNVDKRPPQSAYDAIKRAVIQLDKKTNNEIAEFDSCTSACKALNKPKAFPGYISGACSGKCPNAYGYKWKYK